MFDTQKSTHVIAETPVWNTFDAKRTEMQHILIVDDDISISSLTKDFLVDKGITVTVCNNPMMAMDILQQHDIDLCILDVRMPQKDGFTLAEEIRYEYPDLPFMFLTGENLEQDRTRGFHTGADDYLAKPFHLEEMYLRTQAILKRTMRNKPLPKSEFILGKYLFKPDLRELTGPEGVHRLTAMENKLLLLLCKNMNQLVKRDDMLNNIWGDNDFYKGRSMNVYITKLRNMLRNEPSVEILNAHGEGYTLNLKD